MSDDYRAGVLLDLDGTLVDSMFHHVVTWEATFVAAGLSVPTWKIHSAVGMGGDRLVPWVLGRPEPRTDALKSEQEDRFLERATLLRPTPGATDLIADLEQREVPFVIASSASARMGEALLAVIGNPSVQATTSDDAGSSKPGPDLLLVAAAKIDVRPDQATMVGDSPWDAEAASRLGMRTFGVRTGGHGDDALRRAGAFELVDDPRGLVGRL